MDIGLKATDNSFVIQSLTHNILTAQQEGNVGIGTDAPTAKLEVAGQVKITGALGSQGLDLSTSNNFANMRVIQNTNSSIDKDLYIGLGSGVDSSVRLYSNNVQTMMVGNGNVGIGHFNPFAPLTFKTEHDPKKIVLYAVNHNDNQFFGFGTKAGELNYQIWDNISAHVFRAGTSSTTSNELMRIAGDGRVGIGTATPTAKLHVIGNVIATGGYADYVLEDYVDGTSALNPSYARKSLPEVEAFIKTNKHLPGVTSIKDLKVATNGEYEIDITKLQVQLLEKIEELYLHTIELQKQVDDLKAATKK
jgi:hypothetical protein